MLILKFVVSTIFDELSHSNGLYKDFRIENLDFKVSIVNVTREHNKFFAFQFEMCIF